MATQPFHAGGAAIPTTVSTLSAAAAAAAAAAGEWCPPAAALRQHMQQIDLTRLGSLIALAGVVPAAWRLLHGAWREAYSWLRQFFIASVVIPGRDPLNKTVVSWVITHVVEPRHRTRFFTARTGGRGGGSGSGEALLGAEAGSGGDGMYAVSGSSAAAGVGEAGHGNGNGSLSLMRKTQRSVQYIPHFETVWFVHAGSLFVLHRSLESFNAALCDPGYDGLGGEELTVSCVGRSAAPIRALVQTCREWAELQTQYFVVVYARDRYGISWQPKSRKPMRRLQTVHFDEDVKRALLADIEKYLHPETQKRYQSRSMPYRRGE